MKAKLTDSKSLLKFIFNQMEKLDKNKINPDIARAQAALARQANNTLRIRMDAENNAKTK
jgi:hypothetical protein